jgi:hypothetical protein
MTTRRWLLLGVFSLTPLLNCGEKEIDAPPITDGKGDSSVMAAILNFEFDGELLTDSYSLESAVTQQVFYTVGPLNAENSVGRLDKMLISNVSSTPEGHLKRVTYHAILPVAWGQRSNIPQEWTFSLLRDVSWGGQSAFFEKYKGTCVEPAAHDMSAGIFWYFYRTDASGCSLEEKDVTVVKATVSPSPNETSGMFPEYHKVWEDNALNVVAIFGKNEPTATEYDVGISAYTEFVRGALRNLGAYSPKTTPEVLPANFGKTPEIAIEATLPDGKTVKVNAFLVGRMTETTAEFDARYHALSPTADLIAYNGHSGVGANIRALARKGSWVKGQYVVVFMNGCDTYAYQDSALADAHRLVNPDEVTGNKYVDLVLNAMPAYFSSDAPATLALFNGLLSYQEPRTYQNIFNDIDSAQVVLVSGEQDNVFVPGYPGDGSPAVTDWSGLEESFTIARGAETRFDTPKLPPGRYRFELSGSGNSDLYMRVGTQATQKVWDCRPNRSGGQESCQVDLPTAAPISLLVRGIDASSDVKLIGKRL